MKTQISKPTRDRSSYTTEYKQEALKLWRASGRSAAKVGSELGIRAALLYRWARTERVPGEKGTGTKRTTGCARRTRSFWSSLKYELVYHHRFATQAEARTAIFDYIETFYNRTRLHSSLAYCSPITFESKLKLIHPCFTVR